MVSAGRALVIGGSMSGLFAALALRRREWDVAIYERVDGELAGRGAGIVAQPQLRAVFRALGLGGDIVLGVDVARRRVFGADGRAVGEAVCPQTLTSWDRVYRLLRDALPAECYHYGHTLTRVEESRHAVTAHFANAGRAEGDLLVGADGLRSTVRGQFLPELAPRYAGYVAWRALVAEDALAASTHRDVFAYLSFCLPPGEQFLGYPVAGPHDDLRAGRRRYNFVWYRPAAEASVLPDLLTDATGVTHPVSIPPPLVRADVIRAMRDAADRLLAPQFREIVHLAPQPFLQPIYDLEVTRMTFGRVAIVGDAAFLGRPHVAAGVVKAAEDAMALARALGSCDDFEAALRQFEQERIGIGRRIVERGRLLGAYLQSQFRSAQERALAQRHHTPEAVMAEIAVLDFLKE
jgi:2-polyprenyl-6-methoxyphenol hydroxylase-like FAD-dependent oxidoreductase